MWMCDIGRPQIAFPKEQRGFRNPGFTRLFNSHIVERQRQARKPPHSNHERRKDSRLIWEETIFEKQQLIHAKVIWGNKKLAILATYIHTCHTGRDLTNPLGHRLPRVPERNPPVFGKRVKSHSCRWSPHSSRIPKGFGQDPGIGSPLSSAMRLNHV